MIYIVLDSGPLGAIANPKIRPEAAAWYRRMFYNPLVELCVPEIADFEVRRELLRAGRPRSITRLNQLAQALEYLPLSTPAMRRAAELWAFVRQAGLPTAAPHELDGDAILAAQALLLAESEAESTVIVATSNVGHLLRFGADAREWLSITP